MAERTTGPVKFDGGTELEILYLDRLGRKQRTVQHTTEPPETCMADTKRRRQGLEVYYASLGCTIISVQQITECEETVAIGIVTGGLGCAGHLQLASVDGRDVEPAPVVHEVVFLHDTHDEAEESADDLALTF